MRRTTLSAAFIAAALVTMGAVPAAAGPGSQQNCVSGTQTCLSVEPQNAPVGGVRGETVELDYTVHASGGDIGSATLTTHQDAQLPADAGSVTINGAPAPPGAVTANGGDLTIDLVSALPLTDGSDLGVSITAAVDQAATDNLTAWASVTFGDTGNHGTATSNSADIVVELDKPDLALQSLGTGTTLVPHGTSASAIPENGQLVGLDVLNLSSVATPARLTFEFPAGFELGQAGIRGDDKLPCDQHGAIWTCPIAAIEAISSPITVDVASTAQATVGQKGNLHVSITPDVMTDGDPKNNAVDIPLEVAGLADLSLSVTPSTTTVPANGSVVITATITNAGADPATGVGTSVRLQPQDAAKSTVFRLRGLDPGTVAPNESFFEWHDSEPLTAGQSVSNRWQVTGLTPGTKAALIVTVFSTSFDPNVPCSAMGCDTIASATITVGAPTAAHSSSSSSGNGQGLPATGTPAGPLIIVAVVLLVAGGALSFAGFRRRRSTDV